MNNKNKKEIIREVKRPRRNDLLCVVCQGSASCHNFGQISCHSCKEFFRRNAFLSLEKLQCIKKKNSCEIRFDLKSKCQRCRLIKCFQSGMSTDHLLTYQKKIYKQKRIEENRLMKINSIRNNLSILNDNDQICLTNISNNYQLSIDSILSASSMISFDSTIIERLSLKTLTDIDKYAAMKLINFIRLIPEFDLLKEEDRIILVKSNLILLLVLRELLLFDYKKQIIYDDNINITNQFEKDKFAHCFKSLCILFYGYEEIEFYLSNLSFIINIIDDNDPLIIQLLMIILLFQKGISINNEYLWSLIDEKTIFHIHFKYIELLFRYLIHRYSFSKAIFKILNIVQSIFKIQLSAKRYQEIVQMKNDNHLINPLLKSLLEIK
ncbi:hypothetical protein I4U23_000096 [Adineta vaga]|nr:hypothetical protein I4U23_000096 [Adineta vaga]